MTRGATAFCVVELKPIRDTRNMSWYPDTSKIPSEQCTGYATVLTLDADCRFVKYASKYCISPIISRTQL